MQSFLAWIWAPVVLFVVCLGLGLLVEWVTRFRVADALVVPLGACAGILLVEAEYRLGLRASRAAVVLAVMSLAGLLFQRHSLVTRLQLGPAGLAAAGTYALFLAPTALSGSWTWAGYNFTNDPANTLTATAWILEHGFHEPVRNSTSTRVAADLLADGYPLGPHLFMGTVRPLVGIPLEALYQTFIAFVAATTAAAFASIARRADVGPMCAVAIAVIATGADLFYVYGQLGGVKEVATVSALATATAIASQVPATEWTRGAVATIAVALAALVPVLSAGGLAFLALFALLLTMVAAIRRPRHSVRAVLGYGLIGALLVIVLNAPSLADAIRFGTSVNEGLNQAPLGQLLRPLPLSQIGGIWFAEDWRLPVPHGFRQEINAVLLMAVFLFGVAGILWSLRRRHVSSLAGLFVVGAGLALLGPRTTPYGESKFFVMLSPFVLLVAGIGAWALSRRLNVIGALAAAAIAMGVLYSDAIVYREVRLAPIDRMRAMEDIARAARWHGLVLHVEWEEWAKYFYRDARVNSPFEVYLGPRGALLRNGIVALGQQYDLDAMKLDYVTSFPAIVARRSPVGSRPPANFHLAHANRYYELWLRDRRITVVYHLPIQGLLTAQVKVPCRDIERFARQARPGDSLIGAWRPTNIVMQPTLVTHSPGWTASPAIEGTIVPGTPGRAQATVFVSGGRYNVWLYGSSGRPIDAIVDGRRVGSLKQVNSPGNWVQVARITIPRGRHELQIRRPGGSLAPGDGYQGRIGPLALQPVAREGLLRVRPDRVRRLCGKALDWVEIVRHASAVG